MKYYIYVNESKENALNIARKTIETLQSDGEIFLSPNLFKQLNLDTANVITKERLKQVDIIISIGGDGTTINASKLAIGHNKPILAINAGRKGFLAGLEADNLQALHKLKEGEFTQKEAIVLSAEVGGKVYHAINDVAIDRDNTRGVIDLTLYEGDNYVISYKADAILVSTPIGSTGYAFSNGGPISDCALKFISMAPICPHSFNSRPYMFKDDVNLKVRLGKGQRAFLLVDGKEVNTVEGDDVSIYKSDLKLKLLYIDNKAFYETVRRKFKEYSNE